jgi:hypothetical protein
MKSIIFISILLSCFIGRISAQSIYSTIKQGNIWMMSDSLGLDFNYSPPKAFQAPIPFPDFANATLCDTFGRLKYYDKVHNMSDQLVMNSDSQWVPSTFNPIGNYQSITWFLPFTGTHITGYVTFDDDLGTVNHYAMGRVIYNRLLDTLNQGKGNWYGAMNHIVSDFDSMRWWSGASVRHANGRDWWVASHRHGDDTIFVMLATPDTMTMVHRLRIGSDNCVYSLSPTAGANGGEMIFSPDGSRLLNVNGEGLVEVYDFDRCSGIVSNAIQIEAPFVQNGVHRRVMYTVCFSPSGRYIYTCQRDDLVNKLELVQYDLFSTSPGLTRVVLFSNQGEGFIHGRLGPDKKIYLVQGCNAGFSAPCIQMDSTYLAVINYPDSGGTTCQLVNNVIPMGRYVKHNIFSMAPNYDLGPIDGSPCDTLGIDTRPADPDTTVKVTQDIWPEQLKVYPNPVQEQVIIESGRGLEVSAYHLYDLQGKVLQESVFKHSVSRLEINITDLPPGHYILEVFTSQGVYRRKMVKVRER